jgi:hypothetical protein
MKHVGPLLTLLVGGVLAAGFGGLSARAASHGSAENDEYGTVRTRAATPGAIAPSASAPGGGQPAEAAPIRPASPPSPARPIKAIKRDYAGYTRGGAATLAIAVRGDKAVAYLCDGRVLEAWLRGSVTGGRFDLTGKHRARLTGWSRQGKITGSVVAGNLSFRFTVVAVHRPSGLYRLTAETRGARLNGGWIVLPGGRQVGLLYSDDSLRPAPTLDTGAGSVNVDGQRLPVQEVTP